MAAPIIKLGDAYLIWSSIVDAPITYGMTFDELREHIREEDGRRGGIGDGIRQAHAAVYGGRADRNQCVVIADERCRPGESK